MSTGTTPAGIPFPNGDDALTNGDNAIQAVALTIPAMAGNRATLPNPNNAFASATVTFPTGRFTVPPTVTLATSQATFIMCTAYQVTATSMRVGFREYQAAVMVADVTYSWFAATLGQLS